MYETTPVGYDIDIITEVAKRLGLEVNIINTAWDGIFAGINVNYDGVCSAVSITEERKETTSDILMSDYKGTGTIEVEIIANEKVTSCFTQFSNDEVDAVVVDSTVADSYLASDPDEYVMAYNVLVQVRYWCNLHRLPD